MKPSKPTITEILLYALPNTKIYVECHLHNGDMWLNKEKIARLFATTTEEVAALLSQIFIDQEVNEAEASASLRVAGEDGDPEATMYYNLDAILAVAFRISTTHAQYFRTWARQQLKEFIVKGFVMDDERLRNPNRVHGEDYFKEQLARIRDIRSSERSLLQKVTDIFIQCSGDYNASSVVSKEFFSSIHNKLYWAICQQTPAELIVARADSNKINMGLTNWRLYPDGEIREQDVLEAKHYLQRKEVQALNKIVSMYLDFAALQAGYRKILYMQEWQHKLDTFLEFNKYEMLSHSGRISDEVAKNYAKEQYTQYAKARAKAYQSDYDAFIKGLTS